MIGLFLFSFLQTFCVVLSVRARTSESWIYNIIATTIMSVVWLASIKNAVNIATNIQIFIFMVGNILGSTIGHYLLKNHVEKLSILKPKQKEFQQ